MTDNLNGIDGLLARFGLTDKPWEGEREILGVTVKALVQTFVDTFATGDVRYRVTFDETLGGATSLNEKMVMIGTAPIYDIELTPRQIGRIMCGLAAHETGHIRDRGLIEAVREQYLTSARRDDAMKLDNLLDDILSEKEFVRNYPGFRGLFNPVRNYVATHTGPQTPESPMQVAIGATRYDETCEWKPEHDADRRYWKEWAATYTADETVSLHLAGVAAGLERLREAGESQEKKPNPASAGPGPGKPGDKPDPAEWTAAPDSNLPACAGDHFSADDRGLELASRLSPGDGEIYPNPGRVPVARFAVDYDPNRGKAAPTADPYTQGVIRDELMRSRTGNAADEDRCKSGQINNRGLHRLAANDVRLFTRRRAPDPGRFNIWLLGDNSSSMRGSRIDLAETVHSVAVAARHMQSMRMSFWAWSSRTFTVGGERKRFSASRLWRTGGDPKDIWRLGQIPMGGTPDADVLEWATKAILAETMAGETPVILMMSDGRGQSTDEGLELVDTVKLARKAGIKVVGVALGADINTKFLEENYGRGNYIEFKDSIRATAKPLAKLLGSLVQGTNAQTTRGR